jgi:crotonobetaine/carnitine-CoA ligase
MCIFPVLTVGATLVLVQRFSASRFWGQVRRHGVHVSSFVGPHLRMFLQQPEDVLESDHTLRHVMYALNCSLEEKAEYERRFKARLVNGYGLSEAFTIAAVAPLYGPDHYPAAGLPAVCRDIRIIDDLGVDVPVGATGEILVGGTPGRTIMAGYLHDPEATKAVILDGRWLRTGDIGRIDAEGFLHFCDRRKEVIKRGGENVSALEVEATLATHPLVAEAAVFGVPDHIMDQAVKAVVVPYPDAEISELELISYCAEHLAKFKVPSIIEFRLQLPKTSIGKIQKFILLEEHLRNHVK